HALRARPVRSRQRPQARAHLSPEEIGELIDGEAESRGQAFFAKQARPFSAEEAFDHRPAEGPDVERRGTRVAWIAGDMRLRRERCLTGDFQEKFLVESKRQLPRGCAPGL